MNNSGSGSRPMQAPRARGGPRGRGRGQGDRTVFSFHEGDGRGRGGPGGRGSPGRSVTRSFTPRGAYRGPSGPDSGQRRPGGAIFMQDRQVTVDARIRDDSDKAVVARLNQNNTAGPHGLPLRPDFGTQGREVSLRVNHFPVTVQGRIYRYLAAITLPGKKLSRRIRHRVFALAEQTVDWQQAGMSGRVAHDSAERLVASFELPQPLTIRGAYHDEDEEGGSNVGYELTLTFEEEVDQQMLNECLDGKPVDSQTLAKVLCALNLVLTAHPSQTGVKIGRYNEDRKHPDQRHFFDTPEPKDIGGGLTVRRGFYTSVRPAHQQLMVNVNTCHAAFYKPQNFKDGMEEYTQFVKGTHGFGKYVRVMTLHNHIVTIEGVSKKNAREHRFPHKEYGRITVEQYYKLKHNIELKYPHLPLLKGPGDTLYPQEVCEILEDEGFKGDLLKNHSAAMLKEACRSPRENAGEIVHRGLDKLGFRQPNPLLESFGVSVGADMAVVPGRILDKPGLSFSSDASANIDDRASWNLRYLKFAAGAQLNKWAVLVIQDQGESDFHGTQDPQLRRVTRGFRNTCIESGMTVRQLDERAYACVRLPPRGDPRLFREDAIQEIGRVLRGLKSQIAPELVLVMLSDDTRVIYDGLKRLCDVELDLATVCMQSSKVREPKGQMQYFVNVALKVNMKLGGINHTLDANSGAWLKKTSTMIMGMDVTHPNGKSASRTPSIVAVVASIDEYFAQYPAILGLRDSEVEIERDLDDDDNALTDMFVSRFELYKSRNEGRLPERVILFRDGVAESQFVHVRRYELVQMRKAFERLGSYHPKLSIIVCCKRHNTRFYPTQQENAARDGNPLPGTVVDRGVTPAYEFDFFLQSHHSLKGTARPTHYFVVHDENGFSADDLERVTYDLSYMFARATKAVSLVSPAYWADVACERGRCYLHRLLHARDSEAGNGGAEGSTTTGKGKDRKGKKRAADRKSGVSAEAEKMWGNGVSGPRLRDTMFYL